MLIRDIQFYKLHDWSGDSTDGYKAYNLASFYGKNVLITDKTDDVLTGKFEGYLNSPVYGVIHVKEGEFKIKIFRKDMSCGKNNQAGNKGINSSKVISQ